MAERKPRIGPPPPWAPAPWEEADVLAIQAVDKGVASADQQKRALHWIIYSACRTYEHTYVHGHPDASRVVEGKREAGLDIVKLCNLNPALLRQR